MASRELWTARLKDYCETVGCPLPFYQPVSDRRGGRTAWSVVCQVNGRNYPARFWYEAAREDQAREDAAEIAFRTLTQTLNA